MQNSVTYFKNRWYAEGTARWSERGLGLGDLGPVRVLSAWPLPEDRKLAVGALAYEAADQYWNPLAAKVDQDGSIPDSTALRRLQAMTYTDGTPVLKDLRFKGWRFVREVLLALDQADDLAFRELGCERWSEANQKSDKNDVYIHRVVEAVVKRLEGR